MKWSEITVLSGYFVVGVFEQGSLLQYGKYM